MPVRTIAQLNNLQKKLNIKFYINKDKLLRVPVEFVGNVNIELSNKIYNVYRHLNEYKTIEEFLTAQNFTLYRDNIIIDNKKDVYQAMLDYNHINVWQYATSKDSSLSSYKFVLATIIEMDNEELVEYYYPLVMIMHKYDE